MPLVRWLLPTPVSPLALSFLALAAGLAAAVEIASATRTGFIAGAVLLQLKNIFDTADGHLARARDRPSYVGRYVDSLVDFIVNVASHAGLAIALVRLGTFPAGALLAAATASVSAFLQCSAYVHATVSYQHLVGRSPVSRVDERAAPPARGEAGRESPRALHWLHRVHVLLYGWQDAVAARLDRWALARLARGLRCENEGLLARIWALDRRALRLLSVLGLGTQLAAFSLALFIGRPAYYIILVVLVGNAYLALIVPLRAARARRVWRNRALSDQAGSLLGEPPTP